MNASSLSCTKKLLNFKSKNRQLICRRIFHLFDFLIIHLAALDNTSSNRLFNRFKSLLIFLTNLVCFDRSVAPSNKISFCNSLFRPFIDTFLYPDPFGLPLVGLCSQIKTLTRTIITNINKFKKLFDFRILRAFCLRLPWFSVPKVPQVKLV